MKESGGESVKSRNSAVAETRRECNIPCLANFRKNWRHLGRLGSCPWPSPITQPGTSMVKQASAPSGQRCCPSGDGWSGVGGGQASNLLIQQIFVECLRKVRHCSVSARNFARGWSSP